MFKTPHKIHNPPQFAEPDGNIIVHVRERENKTYAEMVESDELQSRGLLESIDFCV